MILKFDEVKIQGFQSIGNEVTINLDNSGITLVEGINNYESLANSNGSGKSSIFEAIMWCIYGVTSNGISDPINTYYTEGCHVVLTYQYNDIRYIITRSLKSKTYKTQLSVKIINENSELKDISGRNKTDTEKLIRNQVFNLEQDIFTSSIFLSQGFNSRLSLLKPSGRKERIEKLTNLSELVDNFEKNIDSFVKSVSDEKNTCSNEISRISGEFNAKNQEILKNKEHLKHILQNTDKLDIDLEQVKENIKAFRTKRDDFSKDLGTFIKEYNELKLKCQSLESNCNNNKKTQEELLKEKRNLENNRDICPTCGQEIGKDKTEELISNLDKRINDLELVFNDDSIKCNEINDKLTKLDSKIKFLEDKLKNLNLNIDEKEKILEEQSIYESERGKLSILQESNKILSNECIDLDKELEEKTECLKDLEEKLGVLSHIKYLMSRQFKSYLLRNIIDFLNQRLEEYSQLLFSNNIIRLVADSNKLDILLDDFNYSQLSGGEKRKVDIAMTLAQRDLMIAFSDYSYNLLIVDEIFDGLDEVSVSAVIDMITSTSGNLNSIFLISHEKFNIEHDKTITVTKNNDRTSEVTIV